MRRNTQLIWIAIMITAVAMMGYYSGDTTVHPEPPPENPCDKEDVTL